MLKTRHFIITVGLFVLINTIFYIVVCANIYGPQICIEYCVQSFLSLQYMLYK